MVTTRTLARRAGLLKPSPTLAMAARAKELMNQGKDVIDFSAGQPDFNTPKGICDAAVKAIEQGKTKYGPSRGFPELRQAICEKTVRENGFETTPNNIVVSCGAKHALYNTFQVILDPGDEVILIAPYWATYADQIVLAEGVPSVVRTTAESGFTPTIEQIQAALTPKTKAIVINSPSNPTGCAYSPELTRQIAEFALKNNLWIISDEIYERLVYGHTHTSIASFGPEFADSSITIMGCSKTYAMTGWRIGFSIANPQITTAMANLQDQVTSNATSFAQFGAIAALNIDPKTVEDMRAEFEARRDIAMNALADIPGLTLVQPQGAFYVFADCANYLGGRFATDWELADHLLDNALVSTVAGSAFDAPGHLRISYACSRDQLTEGIARINTALADIPR